MLRKEGYFLKSLFTPIFQNSSPMQGFILSVQWVYNYEILVVKGQSPELHRGFLCDCQIMATASAVFGTIAYEIADLTLRMLK